MQKIVGSVQKFKSAVRRDDDVVDRLSNRYTVMIMVVFAVIVSSQLYMGKPITCWVPKHFTGSHTKYTNSYCWVKNTYYLPFEEYIPQEHEEDKRHTIVYYQWMPFIMLAQAIFFYLPSIVWNGLNQKAGVDCDNILAAAGTFSKATDVDKKNRGLKLITNQIDRFLNSRIDRGDSKMSIQSFITKTCCFVCGRRLGNYLIILYIFTKVLYIVNVLGQLFILNAVLRTQFNVYGVEFIKNVQDGNHWINSPAFPRVTMCDFKVRRLGNIQRYTVQCVLPINMYTEKIYAFLWFWYVFIACITCVSLLVWVLRVALFQDRFRYIYNHLQLQEKPGKESKKKKIPTATLR